MKKFLNKFNLLSRDYYQEIPADDILSKQRYKLFFIFSVATMVVSLAVASQVYFTLHLTNFILWTLVMLCPVLVLNYLALQKYKKIKIGYAVTVMSTFVVLHVLTYYSGGIRNSGMFYLGSITLCCFMLLGNRAGKIFFLLAICHLAYFFYITENTNLVSNVLVGNEGNMIDQDFLITGILALFFITAQINSLEGNKNIVISKITESRNELAEKNRTLQEYTGKLEKTNRELDKFASIVSHDLKAPLRAIGNLTGWIEEDAGETFAPDIRANFNMIKGRVKRMEDLINAILDYSKADKERGVEEQFGTKDLIEETIDFIGKPDNAIVELTTEFPILNTDRIRMQQIFANLIGNAIKYNDKKDIHVKVSAEKQKDGYTFSVKDNGPGIDPQYHEKVFVIFQTLNRRDDVESTGVGLAIVKKIIEDQGGKIWIESELGGGSDFKFFWPTEKKQQDAVLIAAA